jgi:MSHA biogenesis protein MshN
MSLINDMLRDLEARRATDPRVPAGLLPGKDSHAAAGGTHRALFISLAVIVFLLILAVAWLAWQREYAPQPMATVAPATGLPTPAVMPPTVPSTTAPPVHSAPAPVATVTQSSPAVELPQLADQLRAQEAARADHQRPPPVAESRQSKPAPAGTATAEAGQPLTVEKTVRPPTVQQQAEGEYQRGVRALRSGDHATAESAFRNALRLDNEHLVARETLAAILLGGGRLIEGGEVLEQGRTFFARNPTLALLLARLRVEQGQTGDAISILEQSLHAATGRADYLAFLAALYQRERRHDESIESYGRALALQPQQASWWVGMAISLENAGRLDDAVKAYKQAADGVLPPQLHEHVRNRLQVLK